MPKQCKVTSDMLDWAFEYKMDGYSFREISRALDINESWLRRLLSESGRSVERPPLKYPFPIEEGELTEPMIDWAHQKRLQGYSVPVVANALHVTNDRLIWAFKKRGLQVKRPPLVYPGKENASQERQFPEGA